MEKARDAGSKDEGEKERKESQEVGGNKSRGEAMT